MKYVLDTNIVSRLLDRDPRVIDRLGGVDAADLGLPIVVLTELLFGAAKSGRPAANRARIEAFASRVTLLPLTVAIAERYASVRLAAERRGRPKSDFDLVIACTALEQGAVLLTHDDALKDGTIDGLVVDDWIAEGA